VKETEEREGTANEEGAEDGDEDGDDKEERDDDGWNAADQAKPKESARNEDADASADKGGGGAASKKSHGAPPEGKSPLREEKSAELRPAGWSQRPRRRRVAPPGPSDAPSAAPNLPHPTTLTSPPPAQAGLDGARGNGANSFLGVRDRILVTEIFVAWREWAHNRLSMQKASRKFRENVRFYRGSAIHDKLRRWYIRACFPGLERAEGLAYNAEIKRMLIAQEELLAVELPRPLQNLARSAALEVVTAIHRAYQKQLGARHSITRTARERMDELSTMLRGPLPAQ
jgi:hypothetical protein